jgi:GAF domain-containing protein
MPQQHLLRGERVVQIADLRTTEAYRLGDPIPCAAADLGGVRTVLVVPLRQDDTVLGNFAIYRCEVRPFTDKQISLLQNFSEQAVIAMENARLLTETREALEQQTATAEVLQVINSSPGDLSSVFDAILEKAHGLCGVTCGTLQLYDGETFRAVATRGVSEAFAERMQQGYRASDRSVVQPLLHGARFLQIPDWAEVDDPIGQAVVEREGVRSAVLVPLRRDNVLLGMISANRREVRPFTDKQIALLQNFAAQAVIAMENARLLTETREALEQQTATAEVLRVISSSPTDVQPTFEAIAARATNLCDAISGGVFRFDGSLIHLVAQYGWTSSELEIIRRVFPIPPSRGSVTARAILTRSVAHVADVTVDPEFAYPSIAQSGFRTVLVVPMLRDAIAVGAINVSRREVRPFSQAQLELLKTFADQAVIAIENVRLFDELRERTDELAHSVEELKALSEVSQAVSSSLDLKEVLSKILTHSVSLSGADAGVGFRYSRSARAYRLTEAQGWDPELVEQVRRLHIDEAETGMGEAAARGTPLQFADLEVRPSYPLRDVTLAAGFRSVLIMPLIGTDRVFGAIVLERRAVGEFPERTIRLMQTLANQSVLAIQNARLLGEIQGGKEAAEAANRRTEVAYRDLKAAQASLIQAEKMASLGQLTAGIAHEIKNPLNFVNNFAGLSVELLDELKETAAPAINALGQEKRAEIDETIGMLTGNLEKIGEHGRRADGIVKSMLEHSRGSSGERRSVDLNGLIEEALNLAYHGARAQDASFNVTLERDFAETIAPIELVPQDITRVCLNVIGNGFYAATKRQKQGGDPNFKPTLKVSTRDLGVTAEVRIRDNGTGIAPEIKDKLFQPFFTTKPTGEGTGLGLSISYDIVTQEHGGTISVDSKVGEFTEFTVRLPRAYGARMAEVAS